MSITGHRQREQEYRCLSYLHHVVIGLDEVDRLVHTVTEEFGTRGLTKPSLFPLLPSVSTLPEFVASFKLSSILAPDAEHTWHEEARFAGPAELAMCLRWDLARVLCISGGNVV